MALEKLSKMVKPDGYAFIDIPSYLAFSGRHFLSDNLRGETLKLTLQKMMKHYLNTKKTLSFQDQMDKLPIRMNF